MTRQHNGNSTQGQANSNANVTARNKQYVTLSDCLSDYRCGWLYTMMHSNTKPKLPKSQC